MEDHVVVVLQNLLSSRTHYPRLLAEEQVGQYAEDIRIILHADRTGTSSNV
jgi:hypothetical protein